MSLKSLQINKAFFITLAVLLVVFSSTALPTVVKAEEEVAMAPTEEVVATPDVPTAEVAQGPEEVVAEEPAEASEGLSDIKDSLLDNMADPAENPEDTTENTKPETGEQTAEVVDGAMVDQTNDSSPSADQMASTTDQVIVEEGENTDSSATEAPVDNSEKGLGDNAQKPIVDDFTPNKPLDDLSGPELVSSESDTITLDNDQIPEPALDELVSVENNLTTLLDTLPAIAEQVSGENSFITTTDQIPTLLEVVSPENTFTTLTDGGGPGPDPVEIVSLENNFNTLSDITPNPTEVVSNENTFTTLSDSGPNPNPEIVSGEMSFTTLPDGGGPGPDPVEVVSVENSFTTLSDTPVNEMVSEENSFTTATDGGGGGGCTSNCGGGGGGGGGGRTTTVLPSKCIPLLYKYIRLGQNNDPYEVFKLQWFLNTFEGFNLKLNGVYNQETFEAVKIFQKRYERSVLNTWGITDSTGYVYITTSLMVNYIYCDITEPIRLELDLPAGVLQNFRNNSSNLGGPGFVIDTPTNLGGDTLEELDLDLPEPVTAKANNFFQAVAVGFLDLFKDFNICDALAILVFLLLLLVLWLIYKLFKAQKENDLLQESNDMMIEAHNEMIATPLVLLNEEEPVIDMEGEGPAEIATDEELDEVVAEYNEVESEAGTDSLPDATDEDLGLSESSTDQTVIPLNGESEGEEK